MKPNKPPKWSHLVLSGGGFSGVSYTGILRYLQTENLDQHIQHVAGTSIGAVFATIFALRIPIANIEERMKSILLSGMHFHIPDILTIWKNYGIQAGYAFSAILPEIEKMTFLDLVKRTGVNLILCATHVQTMNPTFFSIDTTPNVLISDALRASIAIPGFSEPIRIGNDHYVDGGISANIPITPFQHIPHDQILIVQIQMISQPTINPMSSISIYFMTMIQRFFLQNSGAETFKKMYPYLLILDECPIPFFPATFTDGIHIQLSEKEIDDAIIYGYAYIHHAIKQWQS